MMHTECDDTTKIELHPSLVLGPDYIKTCEGTVLFIDDISMAPSGIIIGRHSLHFGALMCSHDWTYIPILELTREEFLSLLIPSNAQDWGFGEYMHAQMRLINEHIERTNPCAMPFRY